MPMKIIFAFLLMQICNLGAYCQPNQGLEIYYLSEYRKLLDRMDTAILGKNDVEIRLWHNNGANKINTATFISLARIKKKWRGSYYTGTTFHNRRDSLVVTKLSLIKDNYDSIYSSLLKNKLLEIDSDYLKTLKEVAEKENVVVWADAGPQPYVLQILTRKSRKLLYIYNPYFNYYDLNLLEYEYPFKIVRSLLRLASISRY